MEKQVVRDTEATRSSLLQAAFKEIYARGFQSASLERILSNTNLTKGALYHHFPNKHALGLAVINEVIAPHISMYNIQPLAGTDDPVAVMKEMIDKRLKNFEGLEMALGCPMNNLIHEMSPLDEEFRKNLEGLIESWRSALEEAFKRGQSVGKVREDVNGWSASMFIIASIEGAIGLSKSCLCVDRFHGCLSELKSYISGLAP